MKKNISKERIIHRCRAVLIASGFSERVIVAYVWDARRLIEYMTETACRYYTPLVGEKYLKMVATSSWKDRIKVRAHKFIKRLNLILSTSSDTIYRRGACPKTRSFPGEIGSTALSLLESMEGHVGTATIAQYRSYLSYFCVSMHAQKITLKNLSRDVIVRYIDSSNFQKRRIRILIKSLLTFAYEQNLISYEQKSCLDDIHYKERRKLPSFYSPQEVIKLESSIDRSTAVGKRDYAMVLLASRLGIRSGDICSLKFSNIDWDRNIIEIEQSKTGIYVALPLLEDVGNAIIDYIRNGRPPTEIKNIFVSHTYPDRPVTTNLITSRVHRWIINSGADISGRHAGPHSLRHSLASTLLNDGVELPVISEALGHEFTSSTMLYLNTDINSLLACSLDVPMVDSKYYNQYGGILYGEN